MAKRNHIVHKWRTAGMPPFFDVLTDVSHCGYTQPGVFMPHNITQIWRLVTCKNCLRSKRKVADA